jgi:hypothetical protein
MSPALRGEVAFCAAKPWMRKVNWLGGTSTGFITSLSIAMQPQLYAPKELVTTNEMCILKKGLVSKDGCVICAGGVWGIDILLSDQRLRLLSAARCMTYTEAFLLSQKDLFNILEKFSADRQRMKKKTCWMAVRRYIVWYGYRFKHVKRQIQFIGKVNALGEVDVFAEFENADPDSTGYISASDFKGVLNELEYNPRDRSAYEVLIFRYGRRDENFEFHKDELDYRSFLDEIFPPKIRDRMSKDLLEKEGFQRDEEIIKHIDSFFDDGLNNPFSSSKGPAGMLLEEDNTTDINGDDDDPSTDLALVEQQRPANRTSISGGMMFGQGLNDQQLGRRTTFQSKSIVGDNINEHGGMMMADGSELIQVLLEATEQLQRKIDKVSLTEETVEKAVKSAVASEMRLYTTNHDVVAPDWRRPSGDCMQQQGASRTKNLPVGSNAAGSPISRVDTTPPATTAKLLKPAQQQHEAKAEEEEEKERHQRPSLSPQLNQQQKQQRQRRLLRITEAFELADVASILGAAHSRDMDGRTSILRSHHCRRSSARRPTSSGHDQPTYKSKPEAILCATPADFSRISGIMTVYDAKRDAKKGLQSDRRNRRKTQKKARPSFR